MTVAGLDDNGDWIFGLGTYSYLSGSEQVKQNVLTRLRSFTNDWFLDVEHGVPWFDLLGEKGTLDRLKREVAKSVLGTVGIKDISRLEVTFDSDKRSVNIYLTCSDVYNIVIDEVITV